MTLQFWELQQTTPPQKPSSRNVRHRRRSSSSSRTSSASWNVSRSGNWNVNEENPSISNQLIWLIQIWLQYLPMHPNASINSPVTLTIPLFHQDLAEKKVEVVLDQITKVKLVFWQKKNSRKILNRNMVATCEKKIYPNSLKNCQS